MLERIVLINNMCIDVFTCLLEYSHESAQQRIPKKNMNEYGFFAKSVIVLLRKRIGYNTDDVTQHNNNSVSNRHN